MQSRIKIIFVFIIVYLAFLHSFTVNAQARMVMNNNAFLVIDNSAKLVVANSSPNAITLVGAGGNLVTESEFDQVKWNISTITGNFVLPFTTTTGVKIPFTYSATSGGSGSGSVLFSTYGNTNWQNSTYMPTDVTHVNNMSSATDNSASMIDRFWIVDAINYTTKPNVTLNFTYVDAEHLAVGNTITEANLLAQRFNSSTEVWGDFLPAGTINTVSNSVTSVVVSSGNFYRSWTLVESDNPMPVELISFNHECENDFIELNWTTATETNNMFFTIEKSENGMVFETVNTIAGAGNSSMPLEYSINVEANKYYRLSQTDYNGTTEEIGNLYANCMEANELVWWQSMERLSDVKLSGLEEGNLEYQLYDMSGKLIVNEKQSVSSSDFMIQLPELPNGMYTISFKNKDRVVAGKVMMVR